MGDGEPTEFPDVRIKKIRGKEYVVYSHEGTVTIRKLAEFFCLDPESVLTALLMFRQNTKAIEALFMENRPWSNQLESDSYPGNNYAKLFLQKVAFDMVARGSNYSPTKIEMDFLGWKLYFDKPTPLILPLSRGFREINRKAEKIRILKPVFFKLEKHLDQIEKITSVLMEDNQKFQNMIKGSLEDLKVIEMLTGLARILRKYPKETLTSEDAMEMDILANRLQSFKREAEFAMITRPQSPENKSVFEWREEEARKLLKLIEDRTFVTDIKSLMKNPEIAPRYLIGYAYRIVRRAFVALLSSPLEQEVIDRHVNPLIDALASIDFDLSGLVADDKDFEKGMTERPQIDVSSSQSVLVTMSAISGLLIQTLPESPGPSSLAVGVLECAVSIVMQKVTNEVAKAHVMSGRLYRVVVNLAGLNQEQRVAILEGIQLRNMEKFKGISWSNRFASPIWGGVLALLSFITLLKAIDSDDKLTIRRCADYIASGGGVALGISMVFQKFDNLVVNGIVRGAAGKIIGVIAAVAGMISAYASAYEQYLLGDEGDTWGMVLNIGAGTGNLISVVGFIMSAAAISSSTVAGVPIGIVLMIVGVIISVVAGIISFIRELSKVGSEEVLRQYLRHFEKSYNFTSVARQNKVLTQSYQEVKSAIDEIDFWYAKDKTVPWLLDLDFFFKDKDGSINVSAIANIIDEDEEEVLKIARKKRPELFK